MGGYSAFAQFGSFIVSQCRYAFNRQSNIHCGSFFLCEINRIISSFSPGGASSASRFTLQPHLYSWLANSSIVSVDVGIALLHAVLCCQSPIPLPAFLSGNCFRNFYPAALPSRCQVEPDIPFYGTPSKKPSFVRFDFNPPRLSSLFSA